MQAGIVGTVARRGVDVSVGQDVDPPGKTSSVNVAATVVETSEPDVRRTVNGVVHRR